jgi:hypothetical protein
MQLFYFIIIAINIVNVFRILPSTFGNTFLIYHSWLYTHESNIHNKARLHIYHSLEHDLGKEQNRNRN